MAGPYNRDQIINALRLQGDPNMPGLGDQIVNPPPPPLTDAQRRRYTPFDYSSQKPSGRVFQFEDGSLATSFTDASGKTIMMPFTSPQLEAERGAGRPARAAGGEITDVFDKSQVPQTTLGPTPKLPTQQKINEFVDRSETRPDKVGSFLLGFARGVSDLANKATFGYVPTLAERISKNRNIPLEAVQKLLEGGAQANAPYGRAGDLAGFYGPMLPAGGIASQGFVRLAPSLAPALGTTVATRPALTAAGTPVLSGGFPVMEMAVGRTAANIGLAATKKGLGAAWNLATGPAGQLGALVAGGEYLRNRNQPEYMAREAAEAQAAQQPQTVAPSVLSAGAQLSMPPVAAGGMPTSANGTTVVPTDTLPAGTAGIPALPPAEQTSVMSNPDAVVPKSEAPASLQETDSEDGYVRYWSAKSGLPPRDVMASIDQNLKITGQFAVTPGFVNRTLNKASPADAKEVARSVLLAAANSDYTRAEQLQARINAAQAQDPSYAPDQKVLDEIMMLYRRADQRFKTILGQDPMEIIQAQQAAQAMEAP